MSDPVGRQIILDSFKIAPRLMLDGFCCYFLDAVASLKPTHFTQSLGG